MLTKAMRRYIENPPSHWDELNDKERQYYRTIEARMRRHIKDASEDLNLLCSSLTPPQLERVYTYEVTDALIKVVEAALTALRAPRATFDNHTEFMINMATRNQEDTAAIKHAMDHPGYITKLEEKLHEYELMENARTYALKQTDPEEYSKRLKEIRKERGR